MFSCTTVPSRPENETIKQAGTSGSVEEEETSNTEASNQLNEKKGNTSNSNLSSDTSLPIERSTEKGEEKLLTTDEKIEKKKDKKKKKDEKKEDAIPTLTLKSALTEKRSFASQNDKIQFCKTLNENPQIFNSVMLTSINTQVTTTVKKEIAEPFKAKLDIESPSLIDDISFIVEYPVKTASGFTLSYTSLKANTDGTLLFTPPKSDFSIDGEVKVYLNLLRGDIPAEDARIINENIAESLKTRLITSFSYKVATANRRISAAIAILDYDKNAKPILSENIVANKLFVKMMKTGFSRAGLAPFETLAKLDGSAIINHAKGFFKNAVDYYIFGKSYITKLEKKENNEWECSVECTLYIWDLKQDKKVLEANLSRSETAKTQGEAIKKARISLGEQEMYHKILYNL